MLMLLHPIRVLRMGVQAVLEWLREDYERAVGELARRRTHSEGLFPFIRVLSNVIVRELQTMAILLDVYLGVPIIYSTFMQYDELGHHFGPSSFQALRDLRRTDARIREIRRMIDSAGGREYDLVILSDHGMTPSSSYRVRFGETLGKTVERILEGDAARRGERAAAGARESFAQTSEYADMGARSSRPWRRSTPPIAANVARARSCALRDWVRSKYGLRELILPGEVSRRGGARRRRDVQLLSRAPLFRRRRGATRPRPRSRATRGAPNLYLELLDHPGVGLLGTRSGPSVHLESTHRARDHRRRTSSRCSRGAIHSSRTSPASSSFVRSNISSRRPNTGDITIFGAYDGYEIVSFDDQIGAHGAAGGNQLHPFLIGPAHLHLEHARIDDARDIHRTLMTRYADRGAASHCWRSRRRCALSSRRVRPPASSPAGSSTPSTSEPRAGAERRDRRHDARRDRRRRRALRHHRRFPPATSTIRARLLGYKTARAAGSSCAPATRRASTSRCETEAHGARTPCAPRRGPSSATLFDSQPSVGTVQITARAAEGVPKFGEPDIIRIVQLLPGVEARNDFSTGFNVRGGESDQNLILHRRLSDLQPVSPRRLVQHVHRSDRRATSR